jgi:hypothetical protein
MMRQFGSLLAGVLVSTIAAGQTQSVTTAAESAKIGAEFRAEWTHDDHGLDKAEGYDPDASDEISVQTVKVKLSGNINPQTEYKFRFNLLNPKNGMPLDYGYGTHNLSDTLSFSVGKMKLLQGGWDNMDNNYRDHAKSIASENFAFDKYVPMFALGVKAAGKITLQVFNDVVYDADDAPTLWNKTEHPTWALGWQGKFGGIEPLLVVGSYDNSKSRWIDAGVKGDLSGAKFALDVRQETRSEKGYKENGDAESLEHVATAATVKVAYVMKEAAMPWIYVSNYEVKQAETDAEANAAVPEFDDNGNVLGLGADLLMLGNGWTPYVAMVSKSGDFVDPADATKQESKTKMTLHLGVLGEI